MLHVVHITKCQKEQLYLCFPCGRLRLALGSVIVPTLLYAAWFACEIAFYCDVSFWFGERFYDVVHTNCLHFVYILFTSIGKISVYHVCCWLWRLFHALVMQVLGSV